MPNSKEITIIPMNIIFPIRGEGENTEALLGIKTRKIGVGMYNGYGGKLEDEETMTEACARELEKECGLSARAKDFQKIAVIDFYVHKEGEPTLLRKCDIFTIRNWNGEPKATEEMDNPQWFLLNNLPFEKMMPDTEDWVKQVLTGETDWKEFHIYKE